MDRALGPRLMKLSVEDVYRWGLPACGPFTATAAGLVKSCFTSQPGVCEPRGGGRKGDGRYIGIYPNVYVFIFYIRVTSDLAFSHMCAKSNFQLFSGKKGIFKGVILSRFD